MSNAVHAHATAGPVRLGISGFGRLAQNYYVPALRRFGGVRIDAVADPAPACRAAAARLLPEAALYASQRAMLDDVRPLDGLLVASPPSAHLAAWLDAASRPPLAVFMEKPFVLAGELPAAAAAPTESIARLMVNFNRRFWPRYRRIGEVVRSGAIGQIVSATLELQVDVSRWLAVTQHRVHPGEGGALYDLGSQMMDLACVIVGEQPTAVRATASTKRWQHNHVETALSFPSLAPDAAVRCILAYDDSTRERIIVRGTKGEARIDDPNTGLHVIRQDSIAGKIAHRAGDLCTFAHHAARRHTSMSRRTIELALAAFVDGIRTGRAPSPGFDDAARNAGLLEAACRSIASGRPEDVLPVTSETLL